MSRARVYILTMIQKILTCMPWPFCATPLLWGLQLVDVSRLFFRNFVLGRRRTGSLRTARAAKTSDVKQLLDFVFRPPTN